MSETVNITPTWEGLIPLLVEVAANGTTAQARKESMGELLRLARIVDQRNLEVAAQPDLLGALQAIADEAGPAYGMDDGPGTVNRMAHIARAAIAKATGEAQL